MASDAPLNPFQPPLTAEVIDAANPVEPTADGARPWGPWGPWATLGWTLLYFTLPGLKHF
ncbi:MAG TPA: hypothetical protein VMV10_01640 [Pirellulales bacterium]|nr:hypothetical protein [Pirellulales bacterium]